jgi:hypothetical protein
MVGISNNFVRVSTATSINSCGLIRLKAFAASFTKDVNMGGSFMGKLPLSFSHRHLYYSEGNVPLNMLLSTFSTLIRDEPQKFSL